MRRLEVIEQQLRGGGSGPEGKPLGPYLDAREASFTLVGRSPRPTDPAELSTRAYVLYKFGEFLMGLLQNRCGHDKVQLLIADSLPKVVAVLRNGYTRNAYRRSVFWDERTRTLFIRKERLETAGEFTLVLLHALAHIKAGDMNDDTNPAFVAEFHRALRVCCEDMFLSRVTSTKRSQVDALDKKVG